MGSSRNYAVCAMAWEAAIYVMAPAGTQIMEQQVTVTHVKAAGIAGSEGVLGINKLRK